MSRPLIALLCLASYAFGEPNLTSESFDKDVRPFFKEYCIRCHGAEKQKAKRRFDKLAYPITDENALIDFQDALDLMNLAEMPPDDEPQPSDEEKGTVVTWLTAAIAKKQAEATSTGGETVLRRLNRREYLNTVGDLFDLEMEGFDPTTNFPSDEEIHHLDNQGDALVTSGFLLEQYLRAAEQIVEKALPPLKKPEVGTWAFNDNFHQGEFNGFMTDVQMREQVDKDLKYLRNSLKSLATKKSEDAGKVQARVLKQAANIVANAQRIPTHIRLYEHPRSQRHMGSYGYVSDFEQGVPHDGIYLVAFEAEAMNRVPPYQTDFAKTRTDEPLTVAIVPGDPDIGPLHLPQELEPELARFELEDKKKKYQAQVFLHKGQSPRFIFVNGMHATRGSHIAAGKMLMEKDGVEVAEGNEAFIYGLQHAKLPQVRISHVYVRGPNYGNWNWPTKAQKELIGTKAFDPSKSRQNLTKFLSRAYRRPATKEDVDRILSVVKARQASGIAPLQAYKDGVKAALCSPAFLYLEEPTTENTERLDDYAIASRLSYFLWSSMPDQRLFDLAKQGKLKNPNVLADETARMLKDPKSDRFVSGFLNSWLTLSSLGETSPDINAFRDYFIDDLESAMRKETHLYARHLLDNNLPIDQFIQSDYTFANPALARLYGIPDVDFENAAEFKMVSTVNQPRGGLLGHASVLTVTANGVDTSPIVRGVWLLENILGTPPSPPPPDIEPLDPDIRGAKTIREQLEKHRADATCAECHRRIDPLGFALENFDAIGRWRGRYPGRGKIDASGELPNGATFQGMGGFKAALMKDRGKFGKALTEKLMAYALGRGVEISDRPEIDAILADLEANERGFGFLVKRITTSPLFIEP